MSQQTPPPQTPPPLDDEIRRFLGRKTRRSFLTGGVAALAGFAGWEWLRSRREDDSLPWPLRRTLDNNEQIARDYFSDSHRAPTFPVSRAGMPKVNGEEGIEEPVDLSKWRLGVEGLATDAGTALLTLDDIRKLPPVEAVNELKCVEGWSAIVRWTGARFSDFAAMYPPQEGVDYVAMETPDKGYYVGLDMASALHPDTLLCYQMDGAPLTGPHGAPLRLTIPVKYGFKSIKRIGAIRFTQTRPADYWGERGYDWYAGL